MFDLHIILYYIIYTINITFNLILPPSKYVHNYIQCAIRHTYIHSVILHMKCIAHAEYFISNEHMFILKI